MTYDEFKQNFLPEFLNINSYAGRIKYANQNLERIGSGSGRIVYNIDGERVLKLAKNAKGVAQNETEAGIGQYHDTQHIVTEVFEYADNDSWIISEMAKKVNEKRIKELTGIPSLNDLFYFLRNYEVESKGKKNIFHQDKEISEFLWENEFAQDLSNFIAGYSQSTGDMGRPSSYGEVLRDGQPTIVLTDYGLNDEVYDTHYSPERKQKYQMYELFNYADGNDDILSDAGGGNDIRTGIWAQMPYSVSDGEGVFNENFIHFVSNRNKYPNKPISGLPVLADGFHETVNNLKQVLNLVENKKQFYSNLLELQNYLTEQGYYNRDPLLNEEYFINEEIPNVEQYSLEDRNQSDEFAKAVAGKLNLTTPRFLGGGANGFAYEINDNLVLKLTSDISEADAASKLLRGRPKYIAEIFNLYKIYDTESNKSFFAILQENINDKPLERLRKLQNDITKISLDGMDYMDIMFSIKKSKRFDYNQMVEFAKQILTVNPEANVSQPDREAAYQYLIEMFNIRQELIDFEIKSVDYVEIANLGYKNGKLKFFDTGGYRGVEEPDIKDDDVISLPEDGSSKFSTDDAINQDGFPAYNVNDTSPSINNNLNANSAMYEDLEYNHVKGDATDDEYMLGEERKKSYMTGSKTVNVKKKCRLGGLGNTSVACNQGDINNLEFGSVNEEISLDSGFVDGWNRYTVNNDDVKVGEIEVSNRDKYMILNKILIHPEHRQHGYADEVMKILFEYANQNKKIIALTPDNIWGANKEKLKKWYKSLGFVVNTGRNKDFQIRELMMKKPDNLEIREYFSSLVPMNENGIMSLQDLPFRKEVEQLGGKIFSVGGAVRDEFLGKESKDLDILVTGIPMDELEQLLSKYGNVNNVGASFGVLKFVPEGSNEEIDVAIPRTETPTGAGGHKGFDVTSDHTLPIEKDLERRDFTINAIAKDIDGNIIDPYNGQEDLKNKIIRIVNPEAFSDDPLRMLRAVQFASRFGFTIEPKTMQMIIDNADRVKEIAPERILIEFDKIIKKGIILTGVELLVSTGLFKQIFGNQIQSSQINRRDFDTVKTMAEFLFLMMNGVVQNPPEFYLTRFSTDDAKRDKIYKELQALDLAYNSDLLDQQMDNVKARSIAHNMYKFAPQTLESQILPETITNAAQELLQGKYPKTVNELVVNGNDIMQKGLKGKAVGDMQKSMLIWIYADKIRNEKEELLSLITNKTDDMQEGYANYTDPVQTWNINDEIVGIDFFVKKYDKWNNQDEKPAYSSASEASVLEFLQNNYEDESTDEKLLNQLYWALTDRDLLGEEEVKKVSYSAVVIDDESRTKLIQVFQRMIPEDWEVIAHHMTIKMGALKDGSKEKQDMEDGTEIHLNVTDYAIDDKVMAVGVKGYESANEKPHITIAVNRAEGGKPYLSTKLTDWRKIGFSFDLKGKITEV